MVPLTGVDCSTVHGAAEFGITLSAHIDRNVMQYASSSGSYSISVHQTGDVYYGTVQVAGTQRRFTDKIDRAIAYTEVPLQDGHVHGTSSAEGQTAPYVYDYTYEPASRIFFDAMPWLPMDLFTGQSDVLDVNSIDFGETLDPGTYESWAGNDVVTLPSKELASSIGYDFSRVFTANIGNDRVVGRDGDDLIDDGQGDDVVDGNQGVDRIVYQTALFATLQNLYGPPMVSTNHREVSFGGFSVVYVGPTAVNSDPPWWTLKGDFERGRQRLDGFNLHRQREKGGRLRGAPAG